MRFRIISLLVFGMALRGMAQQPSLVDTALQAKPVLDVPAFGNSHMNILFNTSFTSDASAGRFDKLYGKINYLKWELKGTFHRDFFYHVRQSLTKNALSGGADKAVLSVDYANVGWQLTPRFSLTAGKQLLELGGYEFWVSGYKVQEFSEFNDCMNNYGTGVTALFRIDDRQTVSLQVVGSKTGSDEETFAYGLPEGVDESKFPLLATFNWDTYRLNRELELRYSLSFGQQAARRNLFYFTSGHVWRHESLLAYVDVNLSLEGVDHKGLVSSARIFPSHETASTAQHVAYFTTIANADYRLTPHWNVFAKAVYELGGVTKENPGYRKGVYFHEWQAQLCAEYYPKTDLDLKLYLHAMYKQRLSTSLSARLGSYDEDSQRIALGIVYAIPVF